MNIRHSKKFDIAYMKIAEVIGELSYCKRSKVGAIIVKNKQIIAEGFNGTFSGAENVCEENDIIQEEWRQTQFENHLISNIGRVKRLEFIRYMPNKSKLGKKFIEKRTFHETILKLKKNKKGYNIVGIEGRNWTVGLMVAKAFIDNPEPNYYDQINHIDFDKTNDKVTNLEWCTNRYNCEHRSAHLFIRDLPVGITVDKHRPNYPFLVRIYRDGKIIGGRFKTKKQAIEFKANNVDAKEYITYRYYKTKQQVLHAESNALMKITKSANSSEGSTLYTTISPCLECAKLIIQAGIVKVVYKDLYHDKRGVDLLKQANIICLSIDKIKDFLEEGDLVKVINPNAVEDTVYKINVATYIPNLDEQMIEATILQNNSNAYGYKRHIIYERKNLIKI